MISENLKKNLEVVKTCGAAFYGGQQIQLKAPSQSEIGNDNLRAENCSCKVSHSSEERCLKRPFDRKGKNEGREENPEVQLSATSADASRFPTLKHNNRVILPSVTSIPIDFAFMKRSHWPIQVGDHLEVRSFESGYRGGWFPCTVLGVHLDVPYFNPRDEIASGLQDEIPLQFRYTIEYRQYGESEDSPDPLQAEEKLFQRDPNSDSLQWELMFRPKPPPQRDTTRLSRGLPHKHADVASFEWIEWDGAFRLGEIVEWYKDGCHWTGRIIGFRGPKSARVFFPPVFEREPETETVEKGDLRLATVWESGKWRLRSTGLLGERTIKRSIRIVHSPME